MQQPDWIQFTWDTSKLPATGPALEKRYQLVTATAEDALGLEKAFTSSYLAEPAWARECAERLDLIRSVITEDLTDGSVTFLTIRHGTRIIGVSGVGNEHAAGRNLITGVCVMSEYRCRGLGSVLLYESLKALREKGVAMARAVTKRGLTADRYLYRKYGSVAEPLKPVVAA